MPTPADIIDAVASLQNDTAQSVYTDAACMPYLNIALRELQEIYELNNVPVTNHTSGAFTIPAGTPAIAIAGTTPTYPTDLIEIQQLWESDEGQNQWTPMERKEFLPHYLEGGAAINQFIVWAWIDNEIRLIPATVTLDIKIDYIKSIFPTVTATNMNIELGLKFNNIISYLSFKTAALCSMFIGENETRAAALDNEASNAVTRALGIATKGRQAIASRRRPFRAAYKMRGGNF
jgi:hypothetical protein